MSECNKCKKGIRGESGIRCAGICGKIFHSSEKCCGLDSSSIKALDTNNVIKFICDECVNSIHNLEDIFQEIQDQNKHPSILESIKINSNLLLTSTKMK